MNPENIEKIFRALALAEVRYVVVGGLAVMAHGYLRMTRDLDLILALDGDNPQRALKVFEELGYRPNVPVRLMDFVDPAKRQGWIEEKGMTVFQLISELQPDCPVDLFVEAPIDFSELFAERVDYQLSEDVSLPVVSLRHLKQLKQIAGRPRDLLDLEELEHLNEKNEGDRE